MPMSHAEAGRLGGLKQKAGFNRGKPLRKLRSQVRRVESKIISSALKAEHKLYNTPGGSAAFHKSGARVQLIQRKRALSKLRSKYKKIFPKRQYPNRLPKGIKGGK